jgi:hypothetical protein
MEEGSFRLELDLYVYTTAYERTFIELPDNVIRHKYVFFYCRAFFIFDKRHHEKSLVLLRIKNGVALQHGCYMFL